MENFPNKKILINNISSLQNNYYRECKPIGKYHSNNNNNNYLSIPNKARGQSSTKSQYKVTYSNSIITPNITPNIIPNKNIENRNIYNIINISNKNTNSSIGSIKAINIYNAEYKNQTNTSYNFYDKKAEKIIFNENSKNKIKNIKAEYINKKLLYSELSKSKSNKFKNRKNGPKSIYANKRPSMPLKKNKNKKKVNELNLNLRNYNPLKNPGEFNSNSNKKNLNSLSKLSNIYNTYNNDSAKKKNKNNLMPISLKHKNLEINRPFKQEIKKCQSQSYFKKYKINNEINTSITKKEIFKNSKSKNKSNNDLSYKGIIMNKKNLMRNNIINSNNYNNNTSSIKNRILCINYNKSSNHKNIPTFNNFNHFMNNIPEEYNKNQQFIEIKNFWNKLKVTCTYQEMFITLTKPYEDKKNIFSHELQNLKKINNSLNKLNTDIKKRNDLIDKIRLFNINTNNNVSKNIEEMKKALDSLRNITIETVLDYSYFFKEISYDLIKNKYDLNNIKNFNKDYLSKLKKDTTFLYYNDFFNKIFSFSDKSDPFLIHPSIKKNGFTELPIGDETLQKISKCRYFLLTEKISVYSLCNNKANINELLFNDQDNIINNLINSSSFGNKKNDSEVKDNNINSEIKTNKNISIFNHNIAKKENLTKTEESSNKYAKFCYINNTESNVNQKENEILGKNKEKYSMDKIDKKSQELKSDKNSETEKCNSGLNNSIDYHHSDKREKITKKILINEDNAKTENININTNINKEEIFVTPYISTKEIPCDELYNTYLSSVSDNIKLSFDINTNIYHYSNIGIYPKLLLFKESINNSNLIGLCTISYSPNINPSPSFSKKILVITSISCQKGQKLSNILKKLIEYCDTNNIIYDSIEIDLHYIKKEDGSYFLDKDIEKEIKSETKFKWVRLENNGEKRRIKYHYINKNNNNENDFYINSIYLNSHVLLKFLEEKGLNDITSLEYSKLYFIINLLKKYYLIDDSINISKDIENLLTNLKGLKLKKIVRMLSEFSNAIQTNMINFKDDYCMNDYYNMEYLNTFINILNKAQLAQNDIICLNYCNVITNFSNVIKTEIDNYEYNIISMDNYIVEAFNINEGNNGSNDLLYFTKSELENISFIFYEFNEDNISINDISIKNIFNKILKKILVKDSEEPIKSYKKIALPSFKFNRKSNEVNNDYNNFYVIKNEVLDEEENLEFCQENNINKDIKFSFGIDLNKNGDENTDIKIIKNNFVLAVLNPDLVLDYHLPSMNIFYIDKSIWKKVGNI